MQSKGKITSIVNDMFANIIYKPTDIYWFLFY